MEEFRCAVADVGVLWSIMRVSRGVEKSKGFEVALLDSTLMELLSKSMTGFIIGHVRSRSRAFRVYGPQFFI